MSVQSTETAPVWGDRVARRERPGIPFLAYEPRPSSLHEVFAGGWRWAEREYLVQGSQRLRFDATTAAVWGNAHRLTSAGVGPRERVLLTGPNSIQWVLAFWAVIEAGAVVVLGNSFWSEAELAQAVEMTDPSLVIAPADTRVPEAPALLAVEDIGLQAGSAAPSAPNYPGDEDDPAVIIFTSGSTGSPKGAVLSHRACIAVQHALLATTRRLPHLLPPDHPADVNLQSGPLFHIGGVQGLLRAWILGAKLVFGGPRFRAREVLDLIQEERVRRWGSVPTMLSRVLDEVEGGDWDLTSLRSVTVGGSPVPADLVRRAQKAFPNARRGISQIYGLSEAGGTLTLASGADLAERPGTAGRPLATVELRIENPDSSGSGHILARSPAQMTGYWGVTDDTSFTSEGWLQTGDLGYVDDEGYLYITGRAKDLIIRGGENVASANVEAALLRHPGVREAAVIGLPDPDLGETVAAVVSVDAGVDVEALMATAKSHLAYFEIPSRWWLRTDGLPITPSGKVDKQRLLRQFAEHEVVADPKGPQLTFTDRDDSFHFEHMSDRWWETETAWFSFFNAERRLGGWFYTMCRPNIGTVAGGVWVWDYTAHLPWEVPYSVNYSALRLPRDQDLTDITLPSGVQMKCLVPRTSYLLRYDDPGRLQIDLRFDGLMEPEPLVTDASVFGPSRHFDQLGRVRGQLILHGETIPIDCVSMRDRTWGPRAERRPRKGAYVTAATSDGDGFLALTGPAENDDAVNYGFLRLDGRIAKLRDGGRRVERDPATGFVTRVEIESIDADGRPLVAVGEPLSRMVINRHTFIDVNSLLRWDIGGREAWGEDQDMWPVHDWSAYRRRASSETARRHQQDRPQQKQSDPKDG